MKIKVTCNSCKKRFLVDEKQNFCPNCNKPLKKNYKHDYSLREDAHLNKNPRRNQLIQIKFEHIAYIFILIVILYIIIIL